MECDRHSECRTKFNGFRHSAWTAVMPTEYSVGSNSARTLDN